MCQRCVSDFALIKTMSEQWLKIFLGKIGSYIVSFLVNYYYYLVPPIIIYGIFLTLSSYNLKKIEKKVDLEIISQTREAIKKRPDIDFGDLMMAIKIPWEDIVGKTSFFPFVSGESDIWVVRSTPENVCRLIRYDEKRIINLLERNGVLSFKEKGKTEVVHENLYLDQIHRIVHKD